jgi:hypothetical protein
MESSCSTPCPFCGQANTLVLEPGDGDLEFITDCEVCCRPFTVRVTLEDGEIIGLETDAG